MGTESPLFELGVVFGINISRRQHNIDVVGGQRRGAFRPVVNDLEGNLQPFLAINGIWNGVESAIGHQAADAPDPHIDAHPDLSIVAGWRRRDQQRLRRIQCLAPGRTVAAELAKVYNAVSVQAVTDQQRPNEENENPSALFNLHCHSASSLSCARSMQVLLHKITL